MNPEQTQPSSTSTQPSGLVTGFVPNGGKRRALLLVIAAAAIAVLLVGGALVYRQATKGARLCTDNPERINRAAQALAVQDETRADKIGEVTSEITALPEYDTDINCLYLVLRHQITIGDLEEAKLTFEQLEQLHEQGNELAPEYGIAMDTIREEVAFFDVIMQEAANNSIMLGGFGAGVGDEAGGPGNE